MDRKIEVDLILRAAGFKDGLKDAERALKILTDESGRTDKAIDGLASRMGALKGALMTLGTGVAAKQLFDLGKGAIDAAEKINQLRGTVNTLIAANSQVYDQSGKMVTGIEKIKAVGGETSRVFAQLQQDAMRTSDTTEGLIEKFSIALGPGLAAGMKLDQVRELTVAASVAMSSLNIDAAQAKSEIKALFSGENLQDADLARGLGLKREDIKLAQEQGRLYDMLKAKMADFVAAGEIGSRSLTGVTSSLDDFRGKLQQIAGENATQTLAEGFGALLDSIQNADGSLTPMGESLVRLATVGGEVINGLSAGFVWLTEKVAGSAATIGDVLYEVTTALQSVAADFGAKTAVESMAIPGGQFAGLTVGQLRERRREMDLYLKGQGGGAMAAKVGNPPPSFSGADPRATIKAMDAILAPYAKMEAEGAAGQQNEDVKRLQRMRAELDFSRFTIKPKTPGGGGTDSKTAAKAEDSRISNLMREMGQEVDLSDAKGNGIAARIAIWEKYLGLLGKGKQAADEVDGLFHKIDVAQIERAKEVTKANEERAKTEQKVREAQAEAAGKLLEQQVDDELARHKAASQQVLALIEDRNKRGLLSLSEYYAQVGAQREADIKAEAEAETRKLQAQRTSAQERYKYLTGQTGKDYDPVAVAKLKGEIDVLDKQLASVGSQAAAAITQSKADIARSLQGAVEEGATAGFRFALEAALAGNLDGMQTKLRQTFIEALTQAFNQSGLATRVGNLAGLEKLPAGGADLSMGAMVAFADATWNRLTLGDRMAAGEKNALAILEAARGGKDVDTARERIIKARTVGDRIFGLDFNVQQGGLLPQEEAELSRLEDAERFKNGTNIAGMMAKAAKQVMRDVSDRVKAEQDAAKSITEAWRKAGEEQKRLADERAKAVIDGLRRIQEAEQAASEKKYTDQSVLAMYGLDSQKTAEYQKVLRDIENQKATIARLTGQNTTTNQDMQAVLDRYTLRGDNMPAFMAFNAAGPNGAPIRFNGEQIVGSGWSPMGWSASGSNLVGDLQKFAAWAEQASKDRGTGGGLANLIFKDRLTGKDVDPAQLKAAIDTYLQAQAKQGELGTSGKAAQERLNELTNQRELLFAQIRSGATKAADALGLEVDQLMAGTDPAAQRRVKLAQIDADIKARRDALTQAGFFGEGSDPEIATKLNAQLDALRDLMRRQVDEQTKYSEQNPLPVAVVQMPKLFALPSSSYFREMDRRAASFTMAPGAVVVNANGLDEAAATRLATTVVANSTTLIAQGQLRENTLTGSTLKL